jgi:hypothetical protein
MRNEVLRQLALNTTLIPDEIRTAIKAGNEPPMNDVVMALLIHALDCQAVIDGGLKVAMTEKLLARQSLVIAFMLALDQE